MGSAYEKRTSFCQVLPTSYPLDQLLPTPVTILSSVIINHFKLTFRQRIPTLMQYRSQRPPARRDEIQRKRRPFIRSKHGEHQVERRAAGEDPLDDQGANSIENILVTDKIGMEPNLVPK